MFTGIVEELGRVKDLTKDGDNLHIFIEAHMSSELKIDQSVAHNGVCLTVVAVTDNTYSVTAIQETLNKSNLGSLKVNDLVNLERGMKLGARLDGHIVQGHGDMLATVKTISSNGDSWLFTLSYKDNDHPTVEKGSIAVNGVSLTVVDSKKFEFSVAIIPHTYQNTTFQLLKKGDMVNLEFDIIGKYVSRLMDR